MLCISNSRLNCSAKQNKNDLMMIKMITKSTGRKVYDNVLLFSGNGVKVILHKKTRIHHWNEDYASEKNMERQKIC